MSYGQFRKKLVPHMREVVFYPDAGNVFDIQQVDGVSYYLLDDDLHKECRVKNMCNTQKYFNSVEIRNIYHGQQLSNIGNEIVNQIMLYLQYNTYVKSGRYEVWVNNQVCLGGATPWDRVLLTVDGSLTMIGTIRIIDSQDALAFMLKSNAQNKLFAQDNIEECKYFVSWLSTKFTRFFLAINISKLGPILTNHYFRFVPSPMVLDEQGKRVPGKFDHIYTDEELYKTWNLPQKYIDVIEAVIKERK